MSEFNGNMEKGRNGLLKELTRLVKAGKAGDFSGVLHNDRLSGDDAEAVRLMNEIISSYRAANDESIKTLDIMESVLNQADAMICVTDPETNEILFMNNNMKKHYGVEDVIGELCFNVLQEGICEQCDFCPRNRLNKEPDRAVVWEVYSTLTKHYYRNTDRYVDWPGGKRVHIQHSVDITDIKQTHEMLDARTKIAVAFLSHNYDTFDELMTDNVGIIADLIRLDRLSLWRNFQMPDGLHTSQIYRWDKESGGTTKPTKALLDVKYTEAAREWEEKFMDGQTINGPVRTMSDGGANMLKAFGVVSAFIAPVFLNNAFWGFVLFEDRRHERSFDKISSDFMRSAAFLIANAVINDETDREINEAHDRAMILLNTTPLCCQLWDSSLRKIDCNEEAVRLFGFKDKRDYLERYPAIYPEYQPDGQRSDDKAANFVKQAFEEGRCSFNWTYKMLDGSLMPAEIVFVRVKRKNDYVVAGYTRDMREHNKMMAEIERHSSLLDVINRIAVVLLTSAQEERFETSLLNGMELIGHCLNADFVQIWQNETHDGVLHFALRHSWDSNTGGQAPAAIGTSIPYSARWKELFLRDECINSPLSSLPQEDRDLLSPLGLKSTVTIPLFSQEKFWGIFCVDDCRQERFFTEDEVGILRSAGLMLVNALLRNELILDLHEISAQANMASRAKSDFLSNMSHEMRTPMNAIIGMTAIGKRAEDIVHKDHALNKIGDASSHLLGVINDVLDLAKIEANKLELAPIEYHFERMLQNVLTVVNFRVDEKEQRLTVSVDSGIPRFLIGDDQRLSQVVTNLLTNAVKFTPEGGHIHLDASLVNETDGECELCIEVTDSGIGISPEQKERLFSAFEQAESGTSRQYGGTGLGLAISKRIVELMGGRIWVESEIGKGSKFIFTMKAIRSNKNPCSMLAPGVNWRNIRIMAVDDVRETREQFQKIFTQLEIGCDVAASGFDACRIIEENGAYDIYFIDWRMPGMDGIELTRKIKSSLSNKPSVVIMITAMDWDKIKDEAIQAGVNKCLLKPLLSSMVIDCVNECLGIPDDGDEGAGVVRGEFGGKRMLVAEDIEINREILMALLEGTGLAIDCAENGIEALEMIGTASEPYDIVFMDVQMPKMDGFEATRRIRALPDSRGGKMPIIAMTANVFTRDIEECLAAGMDDHLGKPLDIDKVMETLRMYLHK